MRYGSILLTACDLVNGERQREYGPPGECIGNTADLWSAYLGHPVTAKDVGICLALVKIAREAHSHKRDNLVDACGYLGLAADLAESSWPTDVSDTMTDDG